MTDICGISQSNASRLAGLVAPAASLRPLPVLAVGPIMINSTTDNKAEPPPSCALQSLDMQELGLEKVILEVDLNENRVSASG